MEANNYAEFIEKLMREGLEGFGLFYSVYRGTVVDNADPDNLGRLKVKCAALYGEELYDEWIFPRGVIAGQKYGVFWIPSIGDPVWLSCQGGNVRYPVWEYGAWLKDQVIDGATTKNYVFQTPLGHRIEMNDEAESVKVTNKQGFHVELQKDGIMLGKGSDNLGKFLDDLFALFAATKVATQGGPQPFINVADYQQLSQKIKDFLKSS